MTARLPAPDRDELRARAPAAGPSGAATTPSQPGAAAAPPTSGTSTDNLAPSQTGKVGTSDAAPAALTAFGISADVSAVRWISLVGLLLSAAATVFFSLRKRAEPSQETAHIQSHYGHMIVPIVAGEDPRLARGRRSYDQGARQARGGAVNGRSCTAAPARSTLTWSTTRARFTATRCDRRRSCGASGLRPPPRSKPRPDPAPWRGGLPPQEHG